MSTPFTPNGMMPDMKQMEEMTRAYKAAMPQELAGAVNLFAHPVAGAAAAGALGIGLASQAFGMWMGAMVGAAEASQKLLAAGMEAEPGMRETGKRATKAARLTLVASTPAPEAAAAARTVLADAESLVRDVAEVAGEVVEATLADAAAAIAPTASPAKPAAAERPAAPDDLKAISGVGPKLEKVLNGLGIWTHAQVAGLTRAEIAWLDDHLGFSGRIGRDDWVGQAKKLAGAKA